jgi:membrane protease subunit (stomatin/prohibitin family)
MINAVKSNNPDYADKFLDMDVPKHTELIPNVKIELNEPKIKQNFIKEIQSYFKESILNQYGETAVFKHFNDLKLAKIIAKSLNVSPKIILGLSDVSYLKVLYSKNFSLLQGKDNDINNPIFSNNKSNLFTFVKSFNKAFSQYQVKLDDFLNDRIFVGLREPIMNFDENVKDLNKAKLYLFCWYRIQAML